MTPSNFSALGLTGSLSRAVADMNYDKPTPIQSQAIPPLLEGRDLLGIAQTGTGKTAAFVLPLLQQLAEERQRPAPRTVRALILAPTRELALQISDSIKVYGRFSKLSHAVVMGGVSQRAQIKQTARGVDILVATPGRLLDLTDQRRIDIRRTEYLVLDEADRMLDMGFIRDVRKIIAQLPKDRQSMLFSATMPDRVARLAGDILDDPVRVEVKAKTVAVDRIDQSIHFVERSAKRRMVAEMLMDPDFSRVIVFVRTKRGADRLCRQLGTAGVDAAAIHGDKSQGARERALQAFRKGRAQVLVATDVVSRGIDVDDVSHVINYELPNDPECYVHRIGRTARAGASGVAISLCDDSEAEQLRDIERLIKRRLTVASGKPPAGKHAPAEKRTARSASRKKPANGNAKRRSRSRQRRRRNAA
ncbi:MAG: DEAD/DEAH box helicase [Pseudomonadota bacterium]